MTAIYYLVLVLFLISSFLLCLVILVQESKSSGLGATFGGGEAEGSLFGTSTPEVLKKVTAYLALIFLGGCIFLSFWTGAIGRAKQKPSSPTEMLE